MKKLAIVLAVGSLVFCGICIARTVAEGRFAISGTVVVPERLEKLAQSANNSCAIIVKNEADVPVAIKRIVNPAFPLQFALGEEDLLASTVEGDLKLEVQINSHGKLGVIKEGDIFGASPALVKANAKNVTLTADQTLGMPRLAQNARGNFFRTAAR